MPSTEIYTLSLHDALPIYNQRDLPATHHPHRAPETRVRTPRTQARVAKQRSEEHTSELQSRSDLVCRLPRSTLFPYTTLFRSTINATYQQLTTPTELQKRAFELLELKLA